MDYGIYFVLSFKINETDYQYKSLHIKKITNYKFNS